MKKNCVLLAFFMCLSLTSCSVKKNDSNKIKFVGFAINDECNIYIDSFKKENPDIEVEIIDFAENEVSYDAINRMNASLVSENCGDIIICNSYLKIENLIKNNLISDLYKINYVKEHKDDYIPNIIKCCESDGKLYSIFPSFSIKAFVCKKCNISQDSWNLKKFNNIISEFANEEKNVFGNRSTDCFEKIFNCILNYYFYNDTVEANYDNLLETLDVIKKCNDISKQNQIKSGNIEYLYSDDSQIIAEEEIYDFNRYHVLKKAVFQDDISLLGFPLEKNTLSISPEFEISVLNKSKNNKNVEKFIEFILSDEMQKACVYSESSFPMTINNFNLSCERAMSEIIYDQNGNNFGKKSDKYYIDDKCIDLGIPSANDLSGFKDQIFLVDQIYRIDPNIKNIISDSLLPYWNGDSNATDTLDKIISKLKIYNSELK